LGNPRVVDADLLVESCYFLLEAVAFGSRSDSAI
jgi:hypothetical protein